MDVKDVMDMEILVLNHDAKVRDILYLKKKRKFQIYPIVDKEFKLQGVVSMQHILEKFYPSYSEFTEKLNDTAGDESKLSVLREMSVSKIMQTDYPTVTPYESILRVGASMLLKGLVEIPVIDLQRRVIGSVTQQVIVEEMMKNSLIGSEMVGKTAYVEESASVVNAQSVFSGEKKELYPDKRDGLRVPVPIDMFYEYVNPKEAPPGFRGRENAKLIDLSSTGARLRMKERLNEGTLLYTRFDIPEHREPIQCLSKVIRREKTSTKDGYEIGVVFLALDTIERKRMNRYIRQRALAPHLVE